MCARLGAIQHKHWPVSAFLRADSHHVHKGNEASFDNTTLKEAINLNVWHSSFHARASLVTRPFPSLPSPLSHVMTIHLRKGSGYETSFELLNIPGDYLAIYTGTELHNIRHTVEPRLMETPQRRTPTI